MSNVSHVSTVDRGLKMKIKRTKVGANSGKSDTKADGVLSKGDSSAGSTSTTTTTTTTSATQHSPGVLLVNGVPSGSGGSTPSSGGGGVSMDTKTSGSTGSTGGSTPGSKVGGSTGGSAGSAASLVATPDSVSKDKLSSPKVKAPFASKKDKSKDKSNSGGGGSAAKPHPGDTHSTALLSNGSTSVGSTSSIGGGGASSGLNTATGGLSGLSSVGNGLDHYPQITMEPRVAMEAVSVKPREVTRPVLDDPYEFNAKVEDGIGLPPKKLKTEAKVETPTSPAHVPPVTQQDASTETCTIGVNTESDLLGPCEPGTSVTLQGIVWQEQTENGLLVVNVTWRDKTYVGTLLDATKNEWAPPRPNCDSPVSDFETRTPKGRGKRGRAAAGTPSSDRSLTEGRKLRKTRRGSNNNFSTPASPARPDGSSSGVKRKARNNEESDSATKGEKGGPGASKRSRSCSRGGASGTESPTLGAAVIECPEPNCKKKYKHINGLRYHQTHAHQQSNSAADEDKDDDDDMDTDARDKKSAEKKEQQMSERAERAKAKEQRLQREKQREKSLEKDCSSLEDNIPLKAFASRVNAQSTDKPKIDRDNRDSSSALSKSVECHSSVSGGSLVNTSVNAQSAMPSTTLTTTTVSSKKKDGGPSMSVSLAVSKTPGTPGQVQQMGSVGCIGGLPTMTSGGNTVQAPVIAVPPGSVASTTTPLPITVAPMGTLDGKDSKTDKSKSKVTARPIVPAPTPLAMASAGPAGQGLGSSSGHPPVSQALKMIQPKPTIMGEYSSVNPALADLKEKRSKTKKKKERDGPPQPVGGVGVGGASPLSKAKEDGSKSDRPAVIKSVASPPMSRPLEVTPRKDGIPSIEVSKPADSPRSSTSSTGPVPSPAPSPHVGKGSEQVRSVQPPGLLKVNSPLHVSAGDRKTPINDDVQSPAYSDISDANDSSSPQQQESPKKDGSSSVKKDDSGTNPPQGDGNDAPQSSYSMFFYNRPSPFLSPNVNTPHASPNSNKPPSQKDKDGSGSGRPEDNRSVNPGSDPMKGAAGENSDGKDPASKVLPGGNKPEGPGGPPQQLPSQQQQQIYQQQQLEWQQKWLQIYSQIRLMPQQAQYQYMAHYGMLDPLAQYILGQQDPHYRQMVERLSQEQKRLQEQQQGMMLKRPEPTGTPNRKQQESRPSSADRSSGTPEAGPSGVQKGPQSMYGAQGPAGDRDRMFDGKAVGEGPDDREQREQQALREKQNENHQILKENIELKSQMERGRQEMDMSRKQEESRRLMFFQQQHRSAEKRKMELHGKPPELKSGSGMDSSPRLGSFPSGAMKPEDIKKEPVDHIRVKDSSRPQDHKGGEDKRLGGSSNVDKGRSSSGLSEPPKTPKSQDQQPGGMGMSVVSSMASPNPPPGPPGQYAPYPYSVIPSHYGPMTVDAGHPMYRPHMIGYATAAAPHPTAFIHPSQLAYRMGPPLVEVDKEGSKGDPPKPSGPPPPPTSEDNGKGGAEAPSGQFYSPVHKIHELAQEKSRVRPSSASPAPAKPGDGGEARNPSISALTSADKQRGSSSPPTQRHLHTHHHTHVLSHGFFPPDPSFNVAMFAANPHGTPSAPALQPPPFSK